MESACVYDQQKVIRELTQGIETAKELRVHLNTPQTRQFLIQKILSSYENALSVLKAGEYSGQPQAAFLPAFNLPEPPISIGSTQCGEFEFDQFGGQPFTYQQDQNLVSKKRKGSAAFESAFIEKRACTNGAHYMTTALPPPSPEIHEIKPTNQYNHYHQPQLSPPNPSEMIPYLNTNLSFNNWHLDNGATVPPSVSFPSAQVGFMEDDYQQLEIPNNVEDELLQIYSPSFISPVTSESNYTTDWGSSPSNDFSADPEDVLPDFILSNFFLLDG
ncbi:WRKY53 [Artemisia annua]|uniref:WRKY53 n=1 Tax=Artemisia annua TaxID=35608 RepID=A0A2U1LL24_ARTAN|nr:WRKY53 [Artemisia annua]